MENNNTEIIVLLRDKIKRIIGMFEKTKAENKSLIEQKAILEKKINDLKKENEKLTIQYNNLKLAKNIEVSLSGSHDAKLKVNRIVREIDKCIALLNK